MGYAMESAVVRAVLEHVTDGVVISDGVGAIRDANPAALRLLGRTHDELIGQVLAQILPADLEVSAHRAGDVVVTIMREVSRPLSAALVHDFNNVLAVILARCELLSNDDDVSAIRTAAETARALLRGKPVARLVSAGNVLEQFAAMVRHVLGDGVELVVDVAPDAGALRVDEMQLRQVLLNLVLNARDAMPDGGRLTLAARRTNDGVEIEVADTGVGMAEDVRARIFEPFFTTKNAAGSGIGLATVADIVRHAGGTIDVASAPGQGTTFRIAFPRGEATGTVPPPLREVPASGGERVLVVDDDDLVLRALEALLTRSGYDVVVARGAEAALAIARDRAIDALVTDVVMPSTTGFAIADALRGVRPQTKVLYLSGLGALPPERTRDGARFLPKPFSATELLRELRALLDRTTS